MVASLDKLLVVGVLICAVSPALALEPLPDPTKPAVELPYESEAGKAGEATVPAPKKEGLQSIIISPQHRAAVINGETIELGGKIGDATLVEINEKSVTLEGAQGKRVMEIFPGVYLSKVEKKLPNVDKPQPKKSKQVIKPEAGYKNKKTSAPVHTEQD